MKLIVDLNLSPDTPLAEALQEMQSFRYQGSVCELLTKQEIYTDGQRASSVLVLKRRDPDQLLNSGHLADMKDTLSDLNIICSRYIAPELISGLLNCGAKMVIHPTTPLTSNSELVCFFNTFYDALSKGHEFGSALECAERDFASMKGIFVATFEL